MSKLREKLASIEKRAYDINLVNYMAKIMPMIEKEYLYPTIDQAVKTKCNDIGYIYDVSILQQIVYNPNYQTIMENLKNNIMRNIDSDFMNSIKQIIDAWGMNAVKEKQEELIQTQQVQNLTPAVPQIQQRI